MNGFLIKQKHIAGVYVSCSSFRSKRFPNLDVEAENVSGACVCVKQPSLGRSRTQPRAGGCEAKKREKALSAQGGSHAEAQGLPAPCSFSVWLYSTAPTTSLCAYHKNLDSRLCLLFPEWHQSEMIFRFLNRSHINSEVLRVFNRPMCLITIA